MSVLAFVGLGKRAGIDFKHVFSFIAAFVWKMHVWIRTMCFTQLVARLNAFRVGV